MQSRLLRWFLAIAAVICIPQLSTAQSVHRQHANFKIGDNVQVSKARDNLVHYENLAAGDLDHTGRMISCIHVVPRGGVVGFEQQCYSTFDGGRNWVPSLRVAAGTGNGDPTEAYGRGDTVYVVALVLGDTAQLDSSRSRTQLFRSADGGRAFDEAGHLTVLGSKFGDL